MLNECFCVICRAWSFLHIKPLSKWILHRKTFSQVSSMLNQCFCSFFGLAIVLFQDKLVHVDFSYWLIVFKILIFLSFAESHLQVCTSYNFQRAFHWATIFFLNMELYGKWLYYYTTPPIFIDLICSIFGYHCQMRLKVYGLVTTSY